MFVNTKIATADSYISAMIKEDQTGVIKIIFDNDLFRDGLHKAFNKIYTSKESWNSDTSIFFIEKSIEELEKRLQETNDKLKELEQIQDPDVTKKITDRIGTLKGQINNFEKLITEYSAALLERKETLQGNQTVSEVENEIDRTLEEIEKKNKRTFLGVEEVTNRKIQDMERSERIYKAAMHSYVLALKILRRPELASQIPLEKLVSIIQSHEAEGLDRNGIGTQGVIPKTVCLEISNKIQLEVIRRLEDSAIFANYEKVKNIANFFRLQFPDLSTPLDNAAINEKIEKPIYDAFIKIYYGLYHSQSGLFKYSFLPRIYKLMSISGKLDEITNYSKQYPDSMVAEAWNLAKKHYLNCAVENTELFTAIYKWSFDHSWFFKKPEVDGLRKELVKQKEKLVKQKELMNRYIELYEEKGKEREKSSLLNQIIKEVDPAQIHGLLNCVYDDIFGEKALSIESGMKFYKAACDLIESLCKKETKNTKRAAVGYTALSCLLIVTLPFMTLIYKKLQNYFYHQQELQMYTIAPKADDDASMKYVHKDDALTKLRAKAGKDVPISKADLFNSVGELRKPVVKTIVYEEVRGDVNATNEQVSGNLYFRQVEERNFKQTKIATKAQYLRVFKCEQHARWLWESERYTSNGDEGIPEAIERYSKLHKQDEDVVTIQAESKENIETVRNILNKTP